MRDVRSGYDGGGVGAVVGSGEEREREGDCGGGVGGEEEGAEEGEGGEMHGGWAVWGVVGACVEREGGEEGGFAFTQEMDRRS